MFVWKEKKLLPRFFISINCHRLNLQKKYIHSTCSHLTTTMYWLLKIKCFNWSMIYENYINKYCKMWMKVFIALDLDFA